MLAIPTLFQNNSCRGAKKVIMSDFNQMADFSTSIDYDFFAAPGLGSTDLNPQLEDNSALKKLQRTFKTSGYSRS